MSSAHQIDGHTLTLLRNGAEYFPRLLAAIESSCTSIYLETYIYADDSTGRAIANSLKRAVERGVKVHLIIDGYGSQDFPRPRLEELRAFGIEVLIFRPQISPLTLRRVRLRRLHRKLVCIDAAVAFIGGINIADDIPGQDIIAPRLDYAVEVRGETVKRISTAMRRLWTLVSWTNFRRHRERIRLQLDPAQQRHARVVLLVRDNLRYRRSIEQAYLRAFNEAQEEIILANAYFLPGQRLRHALLQAAQRGVKVVLILQGKAEYRLQHFATLALYDELLRAGMEIHEYHASYLHAKVAVIDKYWSTVGSSNIEPFSLWLAREANLLVRDADFAGALRTSLLQEIAQNCHLVDHSTWSKRSIWMRMVTRASYAFMRLLTGVIGNVRGQDDV